MVPKEVRRAFYVPHTMATRRYYYLCWRQVLKHDGESYKRKLWGPSHSIIFERKRLLRENKELARFICKHNLIDSVDERLQRNALHRAVEQKKESGKHFGRPWNRRKRSRQKGQTALHIVSKHKIQDYFLVA